MTYREFTAKAENLVIVEDENTKEWYLDPDWRHILYHHDMRDLKIISDSYDLTWADLESIFKLEVEMRNTLRSRKNVVINWLYHVIEERAKPFELDTETEMIRNMFKWQKEDKEDEELEDE